MRTNETAKGGGPSYMLNTMFLSRIKISTVFTEVAMYFHVYVLSCLVKRSVWIRLERIHLVKRGTTVSCQINKIWYWEFEYHVLKMAVSSSSKDILYEIICIIEPKVLTSYLTER